MPVTPRTTSAPPAARGRAAPSSAEQSSAIELSVPVDAIADAIAARLAEWLAGRLATPVAEPWLDAERAAEHIAAPVSRVYALTSAGRIPHHRDGSRVLFRASELDQWIIRDGGARRP